MSPDLIASLHIMWKGMLGLFISCGFISLLIIALNGIVKKIKKTDTPAT
jgi:cell division protein FtsX